MAISPRQPDQAKPIQARWAYATDRPHLGGMRGFWQPASDRPFPPIRLTRHRCFPALGVALDRIPACSHNSTHHGVTAGLESFESLREHDHAAHAQRSLMRLPPARWAQSKKL